MTTTRSADRPAALNRTTGDPAFTPGPWKMANWGNVVANDGRGVLNINRRFSSEIEANARLIAAAPDMYEALKMARQCIGYCRRAHPDAQSGEGFPVELIIDAALAKAEGKQ